MTEEEAKTKWCPMAQRIAGDAMEFGIKNCIGSACMMWRWDKVRQTSYQGTRDRLDGDRLIPVRPDGERWRVCTDVKPAHPGWTNWKLEHVPDSGHCGLAGKP